MSSSLYSPFALQGATLAFAWFFVINLVACAAVTVIARRQAGRRSDPSPGLWFALRVLPAASALGFVIMIFVPSYWRYEPRQATEAVDLTLKVCAIAAIVMLGTAGYRGVSAWCSAVRRTRAWMRTARPLALPGTTIPAFEVDAEAPVLALAGVLRPRLLVTRALVEALTTEELAASVAHEIGHSHARDNLKRLAMRSAPDLFGATSSARAIERRWAAAAEHCADRIASDHHPAARCALASALLKVARLTPTPPPLAEPISTLVGGGDIASRVRSLLDDRARTSTAPTPRSRWIRSAPAVLAIAIIYPPLLRVVHHATEALVQFLP
jgi:Zn-dependent protease with chaperone function